MINLPVPKERNLFLNKQIDQDSVNAVLSAIININDDDQILINAYNAYGFDYIPKPIKVFIDSYGGYVYQALGLISVIEKSIVPVHTIVTGCAMSSGFNIAICGHRRFAYQHSTFLYHQLSSNLSDNIEGLAQETIRLIALQEKIESIVINRTKITKKQLLKIRKSKKDLVLNANEAKALKIIDEIV